MYFASVLCVQNSEVTGTLRTLNTANELPFSLESPLENVAKCMRFTSPANLSISRRAHGSASSLLHVQIPQFGDGRIGRRTFRTGAASCHRGHTLLVFLLHVIRKCQLLLSFGALDDSTELPFHDTCQFDTKFVIPVLPSLFVLIGG